MEPAWCVAPFSLRWDGRAAVIVWPRARAAVRPPVIPETALRERRARAAQRILRSRSFHRTGPRTAHRLLRRAANHVPFLLYRHPPRTDAFAEDREDSGSKVHIRIQQRNGRKSITTVQGLEDDLDLKKILRSFKKNFKCNGAITDHKRYGEVIQLQGDLRSQVRDFLVDHQICTMEQVQIHGF